MGESLSKKYIDYGVHLADGGKYRYKLRRKWDDNKPMVMFIMLNPSVANHLQDDPTVRRCVNFAKSWGYGGLFIGNLFPFVATNPKDLEIAQNPHGLNNRDYIKEMMEQSDIVIIAWGNSKIADQSEKIFEGIDLKGKLHYLELSKTGSPKHPLYLKKDTQPKKYETPVKGLIYG